MSLSQRLKQLIGQFGAERRRWEAESIYYTKSEAATRLHDVKPSRVTDVASAEWQRLWMRDV